MNVVAMNIVAILALLACSDKSGDTGAAIDSGGDGGDVRQTVGCEDRHAAFIAAVEADLAASDAPGVSAAVMEDGVVTCRIARGLRAADSTQPPGVDTLFQIGSTTKMFTAVALLQKVEEGALSLSDSLADAVPGSEFAYDETWNDAILLEHLLTHQGGFYDYIDPLASSDDDDLAGFHQDIFFPYLWLMNDPGVFWNYSNPNFDLAGLAAEIHDDRYYPDIMLEDVFGPLGMTRTVQRKTQVEADGDYALGVGYRYTSPTTVAYGPVPMDAVTDAAHGRPAGTSTWSTPAEVLLMARFLMEGDPAVLSDALRQEMVRGHVPFLNTPDDARYGYGVMNFPGIQFSDTDYRALELWSHGGNTNSYSSELWMVPDQGFAVSILSSAYLTDFSGSVIAALDSLADLPDPTTPPAYPWDSSRLDDHVGHYVDSYNVGSFDITREGDQLLVSAPDLDAAGLDYAAELYPLGTDVWLMEIDGAWYDLTFVRDDGDDRSRWIRNRLFVVTRAAAGASDQRITVRLPRGAALPPRPLVGPQPPAHAVTAPALSPSRSPAAEAAP